MLKLKVKTDRKWFWRIVDLINPLRDPSLTVAVVLTFIEEVGQHDIWYWIIVIGLVNWLAVRGVVWLVVNFTFAFTFISRRVWWAIRHPRLAWRILDAVGHEEIVIGGLPSLPEGMLLPEGTTIMSPALDGSGIHILGDLPPGMQFPMLGMPNGQMFPHATEMGSSGLSPVPTTGGFPANTGNQGAYSANAGMYAGPPQMGVSQNGNGFVSPQTPEGLPQAFPHRPSAEEERLRQQLEVYARLLDDWMQFTEEKWRTVSDSQLGWKPLRGRWGSWEDIFQDTYAAKTSDPMAQAAQAAGEATSRRFENSKEKGSAASAVACFLRDMMTLRRGLDMMQPSSENSPETPAMQPVVQPSATQFAGNKSSGPLRGTGTGGLGNASPRSSLIRRPAQIFVDANTEK